jgi:hypothetical protein
MLIVVILVRVPSKDVSGPVVEEAHILLILTEVLGWHRFDALEPVTGHKAVRKHVEFEAGQVSFKQMTCAIVSILQNRINLFVEIISIFHLPPGKLCCSWVFYPSGQS